MPRTTAAAAKRVTEVIRAARIGHMPAAGAVCARLRKNSPMRTPETSAMPTPGGRPPAPAEPARRSISVCWLTSTMAPMPTRMPSDRQPARPLAQEHGGDDGDDHGADRGGGSDHGHPPDRQGPVEQGHPAAAGEPGGDPPEQVGAGRGRPRE